MSSDALELFRDNARDFLGRADTLQRLRRLRNTVPGFDRRVWQGMAQGGWLALLASEDDGGLGLGLAEASAIAEEIGWHLAPEPFVGAGVQAPSALAAAPAGALRRSLLEQLFSGDLLIGLAWQDEAGQIDAGSRLAVLSADGADWRLSGRKKFVIPGHGADGWLVDCAGPDGAVLIWLPASAAGLTLLDTTRIDGSLMSELVFDQVPVPAGDVLARGEAVPALLRDANDRARIAQGAELLGVARRALAITLDYVKTRVQFGKPIGSFQALQHRLVDAFIQTELASACIADALGLIARDGESAALAAQASRVKARCAETALAVTRMSIQMHGAIGFTDECNIGLYLKRALHLAAWLGGVAVHRQRYVETHGVTVEVEESLPDARLPDEFPRDADWEAMSEADFRAMARGFFVRHFPAHLRNMPRRVHWDEIRDWYFTLSRQGWIAPAWPKKFGGMGLPTDKLLAFIEEQEQYGVARAPDQGIIMMGPVLIRYGTPAQQAYYLPRILSGEHVWCQGYSEPNAGSDLASLRTEALLVGDDFIVSGQKIWTTLAQDATHIFTLVRTDKVARKQAGISFVLIDLATPGITIRPIRDIAGHEEFCEVFFDQVRVPQSNLVGKLNEGWSIAKALLGFERIFLGSPKQSTYALAQLDALARSLHLFDDPAFVARYAELQLDVADLGAAYGHFANIVKRGESLPPSVSLLKIWATETYKKIGIVLAEAAMEAGGDQVGGAVGMAPGQGGANILTPLLNATSATIYGGSNEIQRNIIAKAVLELPD